MLRRFHRFSFPLLWVSFFGAWRGGALGPEAWAADQSPGSAVAGEDYGSVVRMSPFEVAADSLDFRNWIKVSAPHFVLYTDAETATATTLVKQMEMVHQAAQFSLHRPSTTLAPLLVVLPTSESDWDKIANGHETEWNTRGSTVGSSRKLLLVHYDWRGQGLGAVWMRLGWHERESRNVEGPLWFRSGCGFFFSTVAFDHDTLTLGRQGNEAATLNAVGRMSWDRFFRIDGTSLTGGVAHRQFEAQSAVVVHYFLTNPEPAAAARLLAWAAYLATGHPATEDSFKQFIGYDWTEWEHRVDRFLRGGKYTSGTIRFPPEALQFPVEVARPPTREMRELFVLSQIESQATRASEASLDALLKRGLKTEALRELLADACGRRGRTDAQLQELQRLIGQGSTNPVVYFDAAYILQRRLLTNRATVARQGGKAGPVAPEIYADAAFVLNPRALGGYTLDTRLDGEDGGQVRALSRRATELDPLYVEGSELRSWSEAFSPMVAPQTVETIAGLARALEGRARTDNVRAAQAIAQWRLGHVAEARALAEQVQASVLSGALARQLAKDLLARTEVPTPAFTAPPAPGPPEAPRAAK